MNWEKRMHSTWNLRKYVIVGMVGAGISTVVTGYAIYRTTPGHAHYVHHVLVYPHPHPSKLLVQWFIGSLVVTVVLGFLLRSVESSYTRYVDNTFTSKILQGTGVPRKKADRMAATQNRIRSSGSE